MDNNKDLKWYQRPVRMMRLDYLDALERMKNADLDALARSKRDDWHINCEWVVGTPGIAPGMGYLTTFNTPRFEKYPSLGDFDLLREYLPYARKYGINVISYLDMHWFSYEFAKKHKDWEQLTANGTPYGEKTPLYGDGTTFCVNSGWRQWACDMVAEAMKTGIDGVFLDGPVGFPGCCYCESCKEKFASRYGAEIPLVENWTDPNWINFVQFRSQSLADFLADCRKSIKAVNPDGVIFLNAGSWQASTWRFARSIECVGPYEDFNGAEAFFHPGPGDHYLLSWAVTGKYMEAGEKPSVVFSHHALGGWHYLPLSNVEAQLAVAQTVACGSNPWIAVFDYALDHSREEAIEPMREMQGFLADHDDLYTGTKSAADVALLNSSQTGAYYISSLAEFYGNLGSGREENLVMERGTAVRSDDWQKRKGICEATVDHSYLGYFLTLTRSHIPFDVVLDADIASERLADYKVLILPNSACLSDSQIEGIKAFVANGGSLIAEFETGAYDEIGRRRDVNPMLDTLGVVDLGEMLKPVSYEEYARVNRPHAAIGELPIGRLLSRPTYSIECKAASSSSVPSVFMNDVGGSYRGLNGPSDKPAMVVSTPGNGRVVYLPSLVGDFYSRFKLPDYEALISNVVRWAHVSPMSVQVDCPPTVQVEPRWSAEHDALLIHFVNNTGDMQRPMTRVISLRDLRVRVKCGQASSVRAVRAGIDLRSTYSDGQLEFTLPELGLYELITIATGR